MFVPLTAALLLLCTAPHSNAQCLDENSDFANAQVNRELTSVGRFGDKLFQRYASARNPDNFFFSPYSLWMAFLLASFGANGRTYEQLQNVLELGEKTNEFAKYRRLQNMYQSRQQRQPGYEFQVANKAFVHMTLPLDPPVTRLLGREIQRVDFNQRDSVVATVNAFSSANTNGLIPVLVTAQDVDPRTAMILANTAYFKGTWQTMFTAAQTQPAPFFTSPNAAPQSVPMMTLAAEFNYASFNEINAEVLELPYTGEEFSMFVFLPLTEGQDGWKRMMDKLTSHNIRTASSKTRLEPRLVEVKMPRFKIETNVKSLIPVLKEMGLVDIFESDKVDLTCFGTRMQNVTLESVIHKAAVEVNEEGTEAAAATALIFVTRSGGPRQLAKPFHMNRPFVFVIMDKQTNNVVFQGAFKNPATATL